MKTLFSTVSFLALTFVASSAAMAQQTYYKSGYAPAAAVSGGVAYTSGGQAHYSQQPAPQQLVYSKTGYAPKRAVNHNNVVAYTSSGTVQHMVSEAGSGYSKTGGQAAVYSKTARYAQAYAPAPVYAPAPAVVQTQYVQQVAAPVQYQQQVTYSEAAPQVIYQHVGATAPVQTYSEAQGSEVQYQTYEIEPQTLAYPENGYAPAKSYSSAAIRIR